MGKKKYVAYVGTYTHGTSKGIQVYDVDVEKGTLTERSEVEVSNASHLAVSKKGKLTERSVAPISNPSNIAVAHSGKYLYSIEDEGVAVFERDKNGDLTRLNSVDINGMRGCYLATDVDGRYLYVAGYHDGKVTVVHTHKDGRLGSVMEGVFHKGLGSVAERTFRPHVSCAERTPDGRFLLVADLGIDQVKIYRFDGEKGTLSLVDAIRCDLESGPRHFMFSKDGKFLYLMYEIKNVIDVYTYETGDRVPKIEKIQTIPSTAPERTSQLTAACTIRMSEDETHLFCSNAGDNSVSVYERDAQTGLLKLLCCLPISGDYPKDIAIFPDGNHLASINHGSNSISFFQVEYKEKLLVMSGRSISVNEPNCCVITKVPTRGKKAD